MIKLLNNENLKKEENFKKKLKIIEKKLISLELKSYYFIYFSIINGF
jgi:hypothetical protein